MKKYEDKIGFFVNVEYITSDNKLMVAKGTLVDVQNFKIVVENKKTKKYWEIPIVKIEMFSSGPFKEESRWD